MKKPVFPLVAGLALAACAQSEPAPSQLEFATGVADVNAYRAGFGLPPLVPHAEADAAARRHAADMVANGFFAHEGSDGSSHSDRLRDAGCARGAENIAWGSMYDQESVIQAWIESPGHRRNILLPKMRNMGLAQVEDHWVMTLASSC